MEAINRFSKNRLWQFFTLQRILLLVILVAAVFVRFYGLRERGIILWDGAYYANIAKTPFYVWNYAKQHDFHVDTQELVTYLGYNGCNLTGVKFGHVFVIFLSMLLFGISEFAVLFPGALAGILTVMVIYFIGARFFSKEIGLIGSLLCALSGMQVAIARITWPQSITALLMTLLLYCYFRYRQENRPLFLYISGILLGLGFLFHVSLVFAALPLIGDFFLHVVAKFRSQRLRKKEVFLVMFFLIMPIMLEEIILRAFRVVFLSDITIQTPISYLFTQNKMLGQVSNSALLHEGLMFFIRFFLETDGPVWTGLYLFSTLFSLVFAVKYRKALLLLLTCQVVVPFLFWSVEYPTIKSINVCYPAVALLSGHFIWVLLGYVKHHRRVFFSFVWILFVISANYGFIRKELRFKVYYYDLVAATQKVIQEQGGTFSAQNHENLTEILKFYMPLVNQEPKGIEFSAPGTQQYKMLTYRQIIKYPQVVEDVEQNGKLVFKEKLFQGEYMSISSYHRLKSMGKTHFTENFSEDWLYLSLYKIED